MHIEKCASPHSLLSLNKNDDMMYKHVHAVWHLQAVSVETNYLFRLIYPIASN